MGSARVAVVFAASFAACAPKPAPTVTLPGPSAHADATAPSPPSAWGPVGSRVFRLQTTTLGHAYVLLGDAAPANVDLVNLARPGSYEMVLVARAGPTPPRTFSIARGTSACALTSSDEVWVSDGAHPAQRAIDLSTSKCELEASLLGFAIEGPVDALRSAPQDRASTREELAWIRAVTGQAPDPSPYPDAPPARSLDLPLSKMTGITTTLGAKPRVLLLRQGDRLVATWMLATVVAEVRWSGRTSLVVYDAEGRFVARDPE